MQPLIVCFILPSFLVFLLSTPVVRSDNSSVISNMMEDMGMKVPIECYTPPDLEEIFLRACGKVLSSNDTCPSVWNKFASAFGYKDPNDVTGDDYNDYFEAVPIVSSPSTVVFWSFVMRVIEEISEYPSITSSANQVASSIIITMATDDDVYCWCGSETQMLDTVNPCPLPGPTSVFWGKFSCSLAESTRGLAFWIGYGNRKGGAYQESSFFANYEFPKLTPDRVNGLVAIDIYDCSLSTGEKCGQGASLVRLQDEAKEKYGNEGYRCYEVCGNPTVEQQVPSLARSALDIIRNEQKSK